MGQYIPITSFGRTLVDDNDAAAARTTLGLGTAAVEAAGAFDAAGSAAAALATALAADPVAANPTASVGTAAVNGSAATFMRSDAAPAVDLGMTPTWTGLHSFIRTAAGAGLMRLQNNSTTGWSSVLFYDSAGAQKGSFGYGNASTSVFAGQTFLQSVSTPFNITCSSNGSGSAIYCLSGNTGVGINKMTSIGAQLHVQTSGAAVVGQIIQGITSQTATLVQLQGQSSTTAGVAQADLDTAWIDSTHATRKARAIRRAYDTAARETDRGWADGSAGRFAAAAPASAPTDAHIAASQVSFYVDEVGNKLHFRVCYADGTTYKTGEVALT